MSGGIGPRPRGEVYVYSEEDLAPLRDDARTRVAKDTFDDYVYIDLPRAPCSVGVQTRPRVSRRDQGAYRPCGLPYERLVVSRCRGAVWTVCSQHAWGIWPFAVWTWPKDPLL